MNRAAWLFLLLTILFLIVQGFFAMLEMSCVSFNKVRLQYYLSKKMRRAIWLSEIIKNPARLFGTTLIGVNAALQFGSETARRFYTEIGLSPDLAPISQVILVLVIAELSPMFAGRRYAEHVTLLGIPFIYLASKILAPINWILEIISRFVHFCLRIPHKRNAYHLSREELQKAIEQREEPDMQGDLDITLGTIFSIREKSAKDLMDPLDNALLVPANMPIHQVRSLLKKKYSPFLLLYQGEKRNVTHVAYPRDFLRLLDTQLIKEASHSPWFITQTNSLLQILKQFRWNNQSLAIVLNDQGKAGGILTLDSVVSLLFGKSDKTPLAEDLFIERSFTGETLVEEVNQLLHINLGMDPEHTLEDVLKEVLSHHPAVGESIRLGPYELTVEEGSVLEVAKVRLTTHR